MMLNIQDHFMKGCPVIYFMTDRTSLWNSASWIHITSTHRKYKDEYMWALEKR